MTECAAFVDGLRASSALDAAEHAKKLERLARIVTVLARMRR